jgi:hypothetical protein
MVVTKMPEFPESKKWSAAARNSGTLAWIACQVFVDLNGEWVDASEDGRFDVTIAVAAGAIDNVDQIAEQLRTWCS